MTGQVTVIVKTFERPRAFARCLASLSRRYPMLPVLVTDDSQRPYAEMVVRRLQLPNAIKVFRLPYDSGLSAGRNLLIGRVSTPWLLMIDDDFVFHSYTELAAAFEICVASGVDIGAGRVMRGGKVGGWSGRMRHHGRVCVIEPVTKFEEPITRVDEFPLLAFARVESLRRIPGPFNPELKVGEHLDFCFRVKEAGLAAAIVPGLFVEDTGERPAGYAAMRNRTEQFNRRALEARGLSHVILPNGRVLVNENAWPGMDRGLHVGQGRA